MAHPFPNLQAALQAALTAYQQGDFSAGVAACDSAIKFDQGQPDALHIRALCLSKLGRIEAAVAAFDDAAKGHPSQHEVYTNHANMMLAAGDAGKAIDLAKKAVKAVPGFADGWLALAKAHQAVGQQIAAAEAYQSCLKVNPALGPARTAYANLLTQMDQPQTAEALLAQELKDNPANPVALNNMATLNRRQGQIEQAVAMQEKAAQAAPQKADILANLARLYQRIGRLEPALAAYETALRLAPQEIDTHQDYNKLLWEMDRREAYLTSYDRAVQVISPKDQQHALLIAKAALAAQVGDFSLALEALEPVSAGGAEQASLLSQRAKIHHGLGDLAQAEAGFRAALKAAPENIGVAHDAAEFLLGRSAFAEAEHILGKFYASYDGAEHLQRHLALRALALRGLGDDRYQTWYDYDRCTAKRQIEVPKGYGNLESFMAAVAEALEPLFQTDVAPLDQTLFKGVQSPGNLWETSNPVLLDLKQALFDTATRFVAELPHEPTHPFFQRRPSEPQNMTFSAAWAVKLARGGGHVDHYHPAGWISSATYISVPKSITDGKDKSGWLRLGASGVAGLKMPAERYIKPEAGHLVVFPSYLWHGVEAFSDDQPRITTPFDLVPIN